MTEIVDPVNPLTRLAIWLDDHIFHCSWYGLCSWIERDNEPDSDLGGPAQ